MAALAALGAGDGRTYGHAEDGLLGLGDILVLGHCEIEWRERKGKRVDGRD